MEELLRLTLLLKEQQRVTALQQQRAVVMPMTTLLQAPLVLSAALAPPPLVLPPFPHVALYGSSSHHSSLESTTRLLRKIGETGEYVDVLQLPGCLQALEDPGLARVAFPFKLYEMLHDETCQDGICFASHGRAFYIQDKVKLVPHLARYFSHNKVSSLQRQLHLWGFRLIRTGPDGGCYYHPLLLRNHAQLCGFLKRVRAGKRSHPDAPHPNFGVLKSVL